MHLVLLKLELVLQSDLQELRELLQHCERQVVSELVVQELQEPQEQLVFVQQESQLEQV
jgi:hypothetical protein